MNTYKPLRFFILLYEVLRFIALISVLGFSLISEQNLKGIIVILLSPQVLYVLMTLFIFFDMITYKQYLPLYVAGKVLSIWCTLLWIAFSFKNLVSEILIDERTIKIVGVALLFLILLDVISVICGELLRRKIHTFLQNEKKEVEIISEGV